MVPRFVAVLVSLGFPGAGHALLGRYLRALVWPALLLLGMASNHWLRYWSFVALGVVWLGATLDVVFVRPAAAQSVAKTAVVVSVIGLLPIWGPLLLRRVVVEAFAVPSAGMAPTVEPQDYVFVDKWPYAFGRPPKRGEVILYELEHAGVAEDRMSRVIALPGDRVAERGGQVLLNGARLTRTLHGQCPELVESTTECRRFEERLEEHRYDVLLTDERHDWPSAQTRCPAQTRATPDGSACVVAADHVFVMSDARSDALDSHIAGTVPTSHVKGRVSWIWMAFAPDGAVRRERLGRRIE